ncbi:MAG TPA: O-antigen ligase family protein [Flavisolibacter sp.]
MDTGFTLKSKNILLLLVLAVLVLFSTYVIIMLGADNGALVAGVLIAGAVGVYSLVNYEFGFYVSIVLGFIIFFVARLTNDAIPTALIVDLQINASFVGLIIHKVVHREAFFKNAGHTITYAYILYTIFLFGQLFNPNMHSADGWILVFRKFLQFMMVYFIALNIFRTYQKIRFFFIFWAGCALFAGAYGCYQEWFGFFDFETNWIWAVPGRAGLYQLDGGGFRKFSTLSGPAAYGIIMGCSSLLLGIFTLKQKHFQKKMLLLVATVFVILGMGYAGTRTAYFIFSAGAVLYMLMTITNKSTLITASFFLMGFAVIMWGPIYGNATINRIRTTFDADDSSLEVRDVNRAKIQPYIYSHPVGGGVATSGIQGEQYNPTHELAGFPPDSGFIKTAVETGWIGFSFQCTLYCLILLSGVRVFYRYENKTSRLYSLAAVVTIFSFVISQYGQVSIGQIPDFFLFYSLLAVIVSLKHINEQQTKELK